MGVLAFLGVHLGSNASFGAITPVAQTAYNTIWYVNGLFGGSAQQFAVDGNGAVTLGASGTKITQILKGTGALIGVGANLAATTSIAFDIAVTGVVKGDTVFAQFATSTGAVAGWLVTGASASTTSGYITVDVVNNTGTTAYPPASVASTTQYLIIR